MEKKVSVSHWVVVGWQQIDEETHTVQQTYHVGGDRESQFQFPR